MQVSYRSVGSSLMKLGSAQTGVPELHKGEIVQAVVEKVLGEGLLRVNLKGMTVEAATSLRLNPGQQLLLRSEGIENGRQVLRIINPAEEQSSKVATILHELGYRTDERLNAITTKLMQYGLPLTRENIDYVLNSTRQLGEFSPMNLEIATWALASQVDSSPEILNAIRSFLTGPQSIKTLVQQIMQGLSNVGVRTGEGVTNGQPVLQQLPLNADQADAMQNPQTPGRTAPMPSDAANLPPQASQPVSGDGTGRAGGATINTPPPINSNPESIGVHSPQIADMNGDVNRLAGEMVKSGLLKPSPDGIKGLLATDVIPTADPHLTRLDGIKGLLAALESVMSLRGTDTPEMARVNLQNFMQSNNEFIKALLLIKEVLSRFPDTTRQVGEQVVQLLTAAEEELLGQAVFNSAEGRINSQQPGFYYFAIPLEAAGQNRVMELIVYKDAQGKRRLNELEEVRLAVALDTVNLGMVVFHVTWKTDDTLVIQGVISRQGSLEIIERSIDKLFERLAEKGFKVDYRGMKLASETQTLRPGFQTNELDIPVLGIDITV